MKTMPHPGYSTFASQPCTIADWNSLAAT